MLIYFAAAELSNQYRGFCWPADAALFTTFWTKLRGRAEHLMRRMRVEGHTGPVVCDSGAHSFFAMTGQTAVSHYNRQEGRKGLETPGQYFAKYVAFMKAHWKECSYFVELDLQEIVGMEQVEKWRAVLRREGLMEKVWRVYHKDDYINVGNFDLQNELSPPLTNSSAYPTLLP